jgi:hypothetical protein
MTHDERVTPGATGSDGSDGWPLSRSEPSQEVVLVVRSQPEPDPTDPLTSALGLVGGLFGGAISIAERAASGIVGATLDRTVPIIVNTVVARVDLTAIVLDRVDLGLVVQRTLDRMDLTQLILDRVDVDEIVARADLENVIDRLPLVEIATYIIDEIDLPRIIRESTGGIASDAMDVIRMQSIDVDQAISHVMGLLLRRRRSTVDEAPEQG